LNIACHFKHLIHKIRFNFGDAFSFIRIRELKSAPKTLGAGVGGALTYESKLAYIFHEAILDAFVLQKVTSDKNACRVIKSISIPWEELY